MDTKSKNSNRFGFLVAGILVLLAVLVYLAGYPIFRGQIDSYLSQSMKNSQLLEQIYKSSRVLYKDIRDRSEKKNHSYYDLYMTVEETSLSRDVEDLGDYGDFIESLSSEELVAQLEESVNSLLDEWRGEMLERLAKGMDYLVVENTSGEMLKNTDREIEKLLDTEKEKWEDDPYVYYVKMSFDHAGNLCDLSVRDEDPDSLLKNTQSVMASGALTKNLNRDWNSRGYFGNEFFLFDRRETPVKVSCLVNENPRDVTFVYALTAQQSENISRPGGMNYFLNDGWSERRAYYEAGAGEVYVIILLTLGITCLLVTRNKRYHLHHLQAFHLHLEFALAALGFLMGFSVIAVMMMQYTNNGGFEELLVRYVNSFPAFARRLFVGAANVAVLTLLFGGWFYFITTFGEVFDLGLVRFVRERSLIVQGVLWIYHGLRNKKDELREEMLHTDLEGSANKVLIKLLVVNYVILALISSCFVFGWFLLIPYSLFLYLAIRKYVRNIRQQYERLLEATDAIAQGNLSTAFSEDWGMFTSYKEKLGKIQEGFQKAVSEEVRSQRMKTELITNVSHDLKTPLTAITTYIELLESETITPGERKEYLAVLKKKSERLKFLIEDLFEVSKANTGNVKLNLVDVDICSLLRQVYLEYEDRVEETDLIFRFRSPEEKVILQLDSQKTYRVFENLYTNIIKYAMPHTRVYVNTQKTEQGIRIEIKNMAAMELDIEPEELTERFVRGDSSRNTEGSGLGLAIARSFVELQGGTLKIEIDGDLFKVIIDW